MKVTADDLERTDDAVATWSTTIGRVADTSKQIVELAHRVAAVKAALRTITNDQPTEPHLAAMLKEIRESQHLFRDLSAAASDVVVAARKAEKQIKKFLP